MDKIKFFTPQELKKLFRAVEKDDSKHHVRNEAFIKIGYYCALRASEIGLACMEDFHKEKKQIYCRRLKSGLNNTLRIIDDDILRSFNRYYRLRQGCVGNEPIFCSQNGTAISRKTIDHIMKQYCEQAKIEDTEKWHFHTLRHTRAVDMAEMGLDVKEVQFWLGHKKIESTMIYFQFTSRQQAALYRKMIRNQDIMYH